MKEKIKQYREHHHELPEGGYFVFYQGAIVGWHEELSDPCDEYPDSLAISETGDAYQATGGDDLRGAGWWEEVEINH